MRLLIIELEQHIVSFRSDMKFSDLIVKLHNFGFSGGDMKRAFIHLSELEVLIIDPVDFLKIDYIINDVNDTLNEWLYE